MSSHETDKCSTKNISDEIWPQLVPKILLPTNYSDHGVSFFNQYPNSNTGGFSNIHSVRSVSNEIAPLITHEYYADTSNFHRKKLSLNRYSFEQHNCNGNMQKMQHAVCIKNTSNDDANLSNKNSNGRKGRCDEILSRPTSVNSNSENCGVFYQPERNVSKSIDKAKLLNVQVGGNACHNSSAKQPTSDAKDNNTKNTLKSQPTNDPARGGFLEGNKAIRSESNRDQIPQETITYVAAGTAPAPTACRNDLEQVVICTSTSCGSALMFPYSPPPPTYAFAGYEESFCGEAYAHRNFHPTNNGNTYTIGSEEMLEESRIKNLQSSSVHSFIASSFQNETARPSSIPLQLLHENETNISNFDPKKIFYASKRNFSRNALISSKSNSPSYSSYGNIKHDAMDGLEQQFCESRSDVSDVLTQRSTLSLQSGSCGTHFCESNENFSFLDQRITKKQFNRFPNQSKSHYATISSGPNSDCSAKNFGNSGYRSNTSLKPTNFSMSDGFYHQHKERHPRREKFQPALRKFKENNGEKLNNDTRFNGDRLNISLSNFHKTGNLGRINRSNSNNSNSSSRDETISKFDTKERQKYNGEKSKSNESENQMNRRRGSADDNFNVDSADRNNSIVSAAFPSNFSGSQTIGGNSTPNCHSAFYPPTLHSFPVSSTFPLLHRSQYTNYKTKQMDVLSEQIWDFHNSVVQTEMVLNQKLILRDMLYYAISPIFPMCGLYVVGSSLNGFGTNSSDMDLCLMITNKDFDQRTDAIVVLEMIMNVLSEIDWIRDFKLITAKVPILRIKFFKPFFNITVDLNANKSVAIRNTHLLCYYSSFDWRIRPLVTVVKEWSKRRDINDANRSSFTSYSLVLMVIHYLQCGVHPKILPSLQELYPKQFSANADVRTLNVSLPLDPLPIEWRFSDSASLADLFIGFFGYYAHEFDYIKDAISVRLGTRTERALVARQKAPYNATSNHIAQWNCICIEEPFTLSNAAHSMHNQMVFDAIKQALIDDHRELSTLRNLNVFLNNLLPINTSCSTLGSASYLPAYNNQSEKESEKEKTSIDEIDNEKQRVSFSLSVSDESSTSDSSKHIIEGSITDSVDISTSNTASDENLNQSAINFVKREVINKVDENCERKKDYFELGNLNVELLDRHKKDDGEMVANGYQPKEKRGFTQANEVSSVDDWCAERETNSDRGVHPAAIYAPNNLGPRRRKNGKRNERLVLANCVSSNSVTSNISKRKGCGK